MSAFNDKDLIGRLQNNDADAFDQLYWKYHTGVYANVMKLLRDEDATADIVQETFISLWEKRGSIKQDAGVAGWLFVVSYNRAVSHLRRIVKETERQQVLLSLETEESVADFEKEEAQWAILEKAVAQLSPQRRKVFELCKIQGKTYEQTALEMGISKHTVKEYLSDAVAAIKRYVQQHRMGHAFLLSAPAIACFLT